MAWIISNIGTVIVTVVLLIIVCLIVKALVCKAKSGEGSCGGNCSNCHGGCSHFCDGE